MQHMVAYNYCTLPKLNLSRINIKATTLIRVVSSLYIHITFVSPLELTTSHRHVFTDDLKESEVHETARCRSNVPRIHVHVFFFFLFCFFLNLIYFMRFSTSK